MSPRTLLGWALLAFAAVAGSATAAALLARDLERPVQVGAILAAAAASALAVGLSLARELRRRLLAQRHWVEGLGAEPLVPRPVPAGPVEVDDVTRAVEALACRQADRQRALVEQHAKLRAVLDNMTEGVLAVDGNENVILLNPAAAAFFGASAHAALGQPVQEIARHAEILRLVRITAAGEEDSEAEVEVQGAGERLLHVRCGPLKDTEGSFVGALLVLADVTRVRRLENVRRDFVANVSHEIRTPLTAIKGAVETLLEGALHEKAHAEEFLRIIERHVDRLNAVVSDLLALSRLEQDGGSPAIALESGLVGDVLRAAIEACRWSAEERRVVVTLDCPPDLRARINAPLLEQAVVNLVDNAIKYSEAGSAVTVEAAREDGSVAIRVRDEGVGVEPEHLPRLFERFYRVDKARSRKVGGTGLGLAIVKHVAHAHGGSASVESVAGKGSTFTITLPAFTEN